MGSKTKVIRVTEKTYEALLNHGTMKDTFDTVIQRLIKDAQKWHTFKEKYLYDFLVFAEAEPNREMGTYSLNREILENLDLIDEDILKKVKNNLEKAKRKDSQ